MMRLLLSIFLIFVVVVSFGATPFQKVKPSKIGRSETTLNSQWISWLESANQKEGVELNKKINVDIPHNWDDYYGVRQLVHGNLHGTAIYQKQFNVKVKDDKCYSIRFEGVGTYATVTLNDHIFERFPVGRTTKTIDVTDYLRSGDNTLTVKCEHPEMIVDMPWVCGGCSSEWGFCEGSQPMGIFRPIVLEVTDKVRVEPFGVHVWSSDKCDVVNINTEVKNYNSHAVSVDLQSNFVDQDGHVVFSLKERISLDAGEVKVIGQSSPISNPTLWSLENPYLYSVETKLCNDKGRVDKLSTPFGLRTISWPVKRNDGDGRFYLNGKPLLINGVCEYEHLFGASHAFSDEQVASRVKQITDAGFNAFRDAHQPHNLEYLKYWDRKGVLFWTQMSSHIWYDSPEFRENFKMFIRQWVKERRNSPSVILWGIENESSLPKEFAEECSEIIREMDPTAENQRAITTCNGGEGTDWNVIQNWSGTYGGNLSKYDQELASDNQLLNGEYGAWRTIGAHKEAGRPSGNFNSEENMVRILETKVRLAEKAKDKVCGQFLWLYNSHDNPGRTQPDEGYRRVDKCGPFNYKGVITPWEEKTDVYYMYQANYTSAKDAPMVYLISHTWRDRFHDGARKATIEAFSNCDSVKLYNDAIDNNYLGCQKKGTIGTHLIWKGCDIKYNVLRAVGYYGGKAVSEDVIVFEGLDAAPNFNKLYTDSDLLKGDDDYSYVCRINCGGDSYTDEYGQVWSQDNSKLSTSWADPFCSAPHISPYQVSQRRTSDPISGVKDWSLLQSFRFGRSKLGYNIPVEDGEYMVELYFIEPWHGTGGGEGVDCKGLRIFDVAVNGEIVVDDLDIWSEVGHDVAYKRVIKCKVKGGVLYVTFPEVKAGQAVISAIAVAKRGKANSVELPVDLKLSWDAMDRDIIGRVDKKDLPKSNNSRAKVTYEAENAQLSGSYEMASHKGTKCVFFDKGSEGNSVSWSISTGLAQLYALRFSYMNLTDESTTVKMKMIDSKGIVIKEGELIFAKTPESFRTVSTTTGTFINAGTYTVVLYGEGLDQITINALDVQ